MTTRRCDDGGACHHGCRAGKCFRREFAAPLSDTGCETWVKFDLRAAERTLPQAQATPLTRDQVEACRRIGRVVAANNTTIGLPELDALYDTALLGIEAIERLAADRAPRDPDRPCEKEHPELGRLCGALRSLGVPCDGFTPAADAEGALRGALSRDQIEIGPHRALLTDYLSGRFIPGMGPDSIDTVESLCRAALAALKHVDASARVVDTRNPPR